MVVRLFPTIKLEVQFLDLLQSLRQRHTVELNSKKTLPSSSSSTNGRPTALSLAAHIIPPSIDNGNAHSSTSNSPITTNGHHQAKTNYSERSQIPKGLPLSLKTLKREPKYFLNQYEQRNFHPNNFLFFS